MGPFLLAMRPSFATLLSLLLFAVGCGSSSPEASPGAYYPPTRGGSAPASAPAAAMPDVSVDREYDLGPQSDEGLAVAEAAPPPMAPPIGSPMAQPVPPPSAPPSPPPVKPDVGPAPPKPSGGIKPLLIYMATFHMAVFETTKAIDSVQALARDLDGYLVRRDDTSIVVRVPSEAYRQALEKVGTLGDVLHREETVEDVTEQFMDLMTRLENARAVRKRVQELLHQAKSVEDALEVERELARITAEIESMEGKLKRLRELVAFSTITIRFQALPTEQVRSNVRLPFPWLERLGLQNLLNL